jgi:hypothetical protein
MKHRTGRRAGDEHVVVDRRLQEALVRVFGHQLLDSILRQRENIGCNRGFKGRLCRLSRVGVQIDLEKSKALALGTKGISYLFWPFSDKLVENVASRARRLSTALFHLPVLLAF